MPSSPIQRTGVATRKQAMDEVRHRTSHMQPPEQVDSLISMAMSAAHLALSAYEAEERRELVAASIERALDALPRKPLEDSKALRQMREELGIPDGLRIRVDAGPLVNPVVIHRRLVKIRTGLERLYAQVRATRRQPARGQPVSEQVLFAADLLQRLAAAGQPAPQAVVVGLLAVSFGVTGLNPDLEKLTQQWRKILRAARALLEKARRRSVPRSAAPLPPPEVLVTLT